MIYPIFMKDTKDVERVSKIAATADIDLIVSYKLDAIDPRSILGLFTFMGKNALLVAPDNTNPDYFMQLIKKMSVPA